MQEKPIYNRNDEKIFTTVGYSMRSRQQLCDVSIYYQVLFPLHHHARRAGIIEGRK